MLNADKFDFARWFLFFTLLPFLFFPFFLLETKNRGTWNVCACLFFLWFEDFVPGLTRITYVRARWGVFSKSRVPAACPSVVAENSRLWTGKKEKKEIMRSRCVSVARHLHACKPVSKNTCLPVASFSFLSLLLLLYLEEAVVCFVRWINCWPRELIRGCRNYSWLR